MRGLLALIALALAASPAFAQAPKKDKPPRAAAERSDRQPRDQDSEIVPRRDIPPEVQKEEQPSWWLRWMLHPMKRGMLIRLPIMDTDPNRGVTGGVMPIWVIKEEGGEQIKQIHAPSVTYNKNFGVTPTYRYYYYPQEDATLVARGSIGKYERELMGQYEDGSVAGTPYDIILRVQYNVDAGQRFFGVGPNTSKTAEANYKENYLQLRAGWGAPIVPGSAWRVHFQDRVLAERIENGPIPNLPEFKTVHPGFAPARRQQSNELRAVIDYDTRDHGVTTSKGMYVQFFNEQSVRGFMSAYDFSRSGFDGRWFFPWKSERKKVTALNLKFEQLLGNAPFWLLPRLGGKYNLRAYGEGRFVDRSMIAANLEQRFTIYDVKMAGVTTEFEVAPFVGMGTVADTPGRMSARYARPVVGSAVRAVARPQVVGSIDFGVGQEGLAVFMDINYSF